MANEHNLEIIKSIQKLSEMIMMLGGFLLATAAILYEYNIDKINVFNSSLWLWGGVLCILYSLYLWSFSHRKLLKNK